MTLKEAREELRKYTAFYRCQKRWVVNLDYVISLSANARTFEVVNFIMKPPFSRVGLVAFRVFANAAVATLDPRDRELLGLKPRRRFWLRISKVMLEFLSAILGHESPSQKFARQRIAKLRGQ